MIRVSFERLRWFSAKSQRSSKPTCVGPYMDILPVALTNFGQIMENEHSYEITHTAFRLLVLDLLALFQAMNQAMINILGESSRPLSL